MDKYAKLWEPGLILEADRTARMQVPLWAEYRLALSLQPVSNAAVMLNASAGAEDGQQVALHLFGVDEGTCPPGTFLKPRPGCVYSCIKIAFRLSACPQCALECSRLFAATPSASGSLT